jgi:S1-C subfamily serine protease
MRSTLLPPNNHGGIVMSDEPTEDATALDAYSLVVSTVAATVTPQVAAINLSGSDGRPRGSGSAVIFTNDGFLLTNAHVVGRHRVGRVSFSDGSSTQVEVVGRDPLSDLAVVRATGPTPPAATLGDADRLRVGQLVVAVGNPLGFTGSITAGVVSALGRSMPVGDRRTARIIDDVIQTDAALNPGNSGGALAIADSSVVGINTAVAGIGLGLAIPINATSRQIISTLLTDGRVVRAYLGIGTRPAQLPGPVATRTGRKHGLALLHVEPGSPADRAGLKLGDVLLSAAGHDVATSQDLQQLMLAEAIGQPLAVTVVRNGAMVDVIAYPKELATS